MAEAGCFSFVPEDVVFNIFFKLQDDPRNWARLACVCTKFSSIVRNVCCKKLCYSSIPTVVSELLPSPSAASASSSSSSLPPPGGWASLYKLAVCCPGLHHAGILLENSDFGLERELGPDQSLDPKHKPADPGLVSKQIGSGLETSSFSSASKQTGSGIETPSFQSGSKQVGSGLEPTSPFQSVSKQVGSSSETQSFWSLYDDLYTDTLSAPPEASVTEPQEPTEPSEIRPGRGDLPAKKRRKISRSLGKSMANAWKRDKNQKLLAPKTLIITLLVLSIIFLSSLFFFSSSSSYLQNSNPNPTISTKFPIPPFDCFKCPQSKPVIANVVENLKYPFLYSLADLGNLPEKPHKNIVRLLKGKPFRKPDISATIQEVLERMKAEGKRDGFVVDVGANVGMASFAAAAMGFKVLAFEPVFENLQRICDGIWFNRVASLVTVFEAVASDRNGDITFHKLVGRLDNSAVSEVGARLAFKSNKEIAVQVKSIPLDELIPPSQPILLIKIDVQGWEKHVLNGAKKLLSRKPAEAPYLIYEEDERLLKASNSSSKEIRDFLKSVGYSKCVQHGTDAHCTKE